ncbi:MAG: ankyrin repeat domain-containing protein [Terracidiphilus sp.]|jgi:ankyrin repeat/protein kinase domain-containing protein 1
MRLHNCSDQRPELYEFFAAVGSGNLESVKALLDVDPNLAKARNLLQEAPLHVAAKWGQKEVTALLLAHGANANTTTRSGEAPLHYAAEDGDNCVVALLVAHGAQIDRRNSSGQTALHWAAQNGHKDVVAFLLAGGAEINARDNHGQTPFHLCARWEPELAALLRKHGGLDSQVAK